MKTFFVTVFFIYIHLLTIQAQNAGQLITTDSLCFPTSRPFVVTKGMQVKITCDTAFLINSERLRFYRQLHSAALSNNKNEALQNALSFYQSSLEEKERFYRALMTNYFKSDSISGSTLTEARTKINKVDQTLGSVIKTVDDTRQTINEVRYQLNKERRKQNVDKWMTGITGISIGLIVGILLF